MREVSAPSEVREAVGVSPIVGCLFSALIGAAAVACLVLVLQLAIRGDITLGRGSPNETRLWLIREDANQGLGLSRSRTRPSVEAQAQCTQTSIHFFLWRSDSTYPPITSCSCSADEELTQMDGSCPP